MYGSRAIIPPELTRFMVNPKQLLLLLLRTGSARGALLHMVR